MRSELESYGVSTRPFLEKSEFVNALEKARAEGLKPKTDNNAQAKNAEPPNTNGSSQKNSNTQQAPSSSSTNTSSRADRLKEEMEKAKTMRVSELKEKLKSMGVNTKSFFEKTEFVRAYAEAVVDGVNSNNNKAGAASSDEPYDPEYRDVVVQKFDPQSQQRYMLSGTIIDIKLS